MVRRVQKRLSEREIGVTGIKGFPDESEAERILGKRRVFQERHLTVFKKIEEREAYSSANEHYLRDIASHIDSMEGISYLVKKEVKEALYNKKLSQNDKAIKIERIFKREGF